MEYVITLEAETRDGKPADPEVVDQAGGRLGVYEPRMSIDQEGPGLSVSLTMEARSPDTAFNHGVSLIVDTLEALNCGVSFVSATVTRGDVYAAREASAG
ncbi:hypothetical protein GCM10029963_28600 [Micromonospora andamanensis]|uniref:hypothetical protein n=1 Tax=Micromonospora andamanensis TaxID=1287068 RepID=UPI00194EEC86|nr:hypothetical protein [Micromonospora andamanensis]GIJ38506.1 hypothetical protein Vwe01_18310 [Micromonospora andamanensis]